MVAHKTDMASTNREVSSVAKRCSRRLCTGDTITGGLVILPTKIEASAAAMFVIIADP